MRACYSPPCFPSQSSLKGLVILDLLCCPVCPGCLLAYWSALRMLDGCTDSGKPQSGDGSLRFYSALLYCSRVLAYVLV
ncbi:hypothetical protein Micbo1qcDRAFT_160913 [Microdochium bolleyi]|uniref:Uncharacterized protein n=1 Tax=Microdochium bolleyi TaxID=196109 RepID=A0A136J767_9PEZI|nr:hypothetical protein Micbo1qcDRAFT_160913 [Microdochium bolleyi]